MSLSGREERFNAIIGETTNSCLFLIELSENGQKKKKEKVFLENCAHFCFLNQKEIKKKESKIQ